MLSQLKQHYYYLKKRERPPWQSRIISHRQSWHHAVLWLLICEEEAPWVGENRLYEHSRMAGLTLPGAARGQQKHFSKYLFLSCLEVRAGRNTIKKWGYKRIQIKWQKYSSISSSSKFFPGGSEQHDKFQHKRLLSAWFEINWNHKAVQIIHIFLCRFLH